jgi:hypothetical protein
LRSLTAFLGLSDRNESEQTISARRSVARVRPMDGAHFDEAHGMTAPRKLPGALHAGEPAPDHRDPRRPPHGADSGRGRERIPA